MFSFRLRYVLPPSENKNIKDKISEHETKAVSEELVQDFLQRIEKEMSLEGVKIIKLIPSAALRKQNRPIKLCDFKLKAEKDGWIRLPVIGQMKGTFENQAQVAREKEIENQVEKNYRDRKETQKELNERWEYERRRIRDRLAVNACELCFRGDSNGLAHVLTLTWFKTSFLPVCFEFACHGTSIACFNLLLMYMEKKIALYQEQIDAHKMVSMYSLSSEDKSCSSSSSTSSSSGHKTEASFEEKCKSFGLYVPWQECLSIAGTRGCKPFFAFLIQTLENMQLPFPERLDSVFQTSVTCAIQNQDIQFLRYLIEKVGPLLFPSIPNTGLALWRKLRQSEENQQEDQSDENLSWWEIKIRADIFKLDLPLCFQLLHKHQFPSINYQAFVDQKENVVKIELFKLFWNLFRHEDHLHNNQVLVDVYRRKLIYEKDTLFLEHVHSKIPEVRNLFVKQLTLLKEDLKNFWKTCILFNDFDYLNFVCTEVFYQHTFSVDPSLTEVQSETNRMHVDSLQNVDCLQDQDQDQKQKSQMDVNCLQDQDQKQESQIFVDCLQDQDQKQKAQKDLDGSQDQDQIQKAQKDLNGSQDQDQKQKVQKTIVEIFKPLVNSEEEEVKVDASTFLRFLFSAKEQNEFLNRFFQLPQKEAIKALNGCLLFGIITFQTLAKFLIRSNQQHVTYLNDAYNQFFFLYCGSEQLLTLALFQVPQLKSIPETLLHVILQYTGNPVDQTKKSIVLPSDMSLYKRMNKAYRQVFAYHNLVPNHHSSISKKDSDDNEADEENDDLPRWMQHKKPRLNDIPIHATMDGNDEIY